MLQRVGPPAFSPWAWGSPRGLDGLCGSGDWQGVQRLQVWSSLQRAELPDKEGSRVLVEVSCGQFLVRLDTAGSRLPGLEKDLDTSSKSPICF